MCISTGLAHGWMRGVVKFLVRIFVVVAALNVMVWWRSRNYGSYASEKKEVLQRRAYLKSILLVPPSDIINAMPSELGEQFQGEYALYACSMFVAALDNMSWQYPELQEDNIAVADSLIKTVMTREMQFYDANRWGEYPLETLDGQNSHMSYLSHLAWMIGGYKRMGGDGRYDELYGNLCETMARRMQHAPALNLLTYPYENVYLPDMLVAIVALKQYAAMNDGHYQELVDQWLQRASTEWIDKETGLLVSVLSENGKQEDDEKVRGSFSALNCYYLSLVDEEFARSQYERLKQLFWKEGMLAGLKEYSHGDNSTLYFDPDSGPILMELSPSGTAFMTGCATLYGDLQTRKDILLTAEKVGLTMSWNGHRHYLLANLAPVGESIMLAMRTHWKRTDAPKVEKLPRK